MGRPGRSPRPHRRYGTTALSTGNIHRTPDFSIENAWNLPLVSSVLPSKGVCVSIRGSDLEAPPLNMCCACSMWGMIWFVDNIVIEDYNIGVPLCLLRGLIYAIKSINLRCCFGLFCDTHLFHGVGTACFQTLSSVSSASSWRCALAARRRSKRNDDGASDLQKL